MQLHSKRPNAHEASEWTGTSDFHGWLDQKADAHSLVIAQQIASKMGIPYTFVCESVRSALCTCDNQPMTA